jgi:hypothetical protein
LKTKHDSEEFDGLQTILDPPSQNPDVPGAHPFRDDPEDKSTEVWAATAATLFSKEGAARPPGSELDFDAHMEQLSKPLPKLGDTLIMPPRAMEKPTSEKQSSLAAERVSLRVEPEEENTDLDRTLTDALREEADTVEMTPEEAAASVAIAQAQIEAVKLLRSKGSVTESSTNADQAVPQGGAAASVLVNHCRVCGRGIETPRAFHFRGSLTSTRGFRCENCHNLVCSNHATRVSGFFESLFRQARFRCLLCMPANSKK